MMGRIVRHCLSSTTVDTAIFRTKMVSSDFTFQGMCVQYREPSDHLITLYPRTQTTKLDEDAQHEPVCRWKSAETHLKEARADVLTIMDSCWASAVINKNNRRVERSFETLAATHEYTRRPGPESFTRALIDSLSDLHPETTKIDQPPFDTSRLHARIDQRMRMKTSTLR